MYCSAAEPPLHLTPPINAAAERAAEQSLATFDRVIWVDQSYDQGRRTQDIVAQLSNVRQLPFVQCNARLIFLYSACYGIRIYLSYISGEYRHDLVIMGKGRNCPNFKMCKI